MTLKVGQLLEADRVTLFILDEARGELWSKVAGGEEIRFSRDEGIAGHVARTGQPLNVADASAEPLFNPEIDRRTGYHTRSLLSMPPFGSTGSVLGVMQLLNKAGGGPFTRADEQSFQDLARSISAPLETWCRLRSASL